MRKDSLIIVGVSIVLTLGIVGGTHYLYLQNQKRATGSAFPAASIPVKQPNNNNLNQVNNAHATKRLKYPQKCIDANGKITITDQPDCANAAPTNNLSIVESVSPPPRQKKSQNQSPTTPINTTDKKLAKKPSLHLFGVTPPSDTPRECKFPVGRALEIERSLSVAKDPSKSIWKESYCGWIKEARQKGCEISREYFYYSSLCQ